MRVTHDQNFRTLKTMSPTKTQTCCMHTSVWVSTWFYTALISNDAYMGTRHTDVLSAMHLNE